MPGKGRPKKNSGNKENIDLKLKSVDKLQNEISSMLEEMDSIKDFSPPKDLLPGLDFEYINHDYDKDIELIKEDAKETLDCISGLYLDNEQMKKKNVHSIIKNDAEQISDIKFSLSCAKLGLINCMKQIDAGANDPNNHMAVNAYQKEIRESSKMINDLLTKMKSFYKELRDEYERKEINEQAKIEEQINNKGEKGEDLIIFDQKRLNKIIDDFAKDKTLIKNI